MHTHRPATETTYPFGGCVAPERCDEAAHGNVATVHVCRCGARRCVNVNGSHVERGPWVMARTRGIGDMA